MFTCPKCGHNELTENDNEKIDLIISNVIVKSIQNMPDIDWEKAFKPDLNYGCDKDDLENYLIAASTIVEPFEIDKEEDPLYAKASEIYGDWIENDIKNWAGFIKSNFGENFGKIADLVVINGY